MARIQINLAEAVASESAKEVKQVVKDNILYVPSAAKPAFSSAMREMTAAFKLIKKAAPKLNFFNMSSAKRNSRLAAQYKSETEKRKASREEYLELHKQAKAHIKNASDALKNAGYSVSPAFGTNIITQDGANNLRALAKTDPKKFRVKGHPAAMPVKFAAASSLAKLNATAPSKASTSIPKATMDHAKRVTEMKGSDLSKMSEKDLSAAMEAVASVLLKKAPGATVRSEGGRLYVGSNKYYLNRGRLGSYDGHVFMVQDKLDLKRLIGEAQESAASNERYAKRDAKRSKK